MAQTSYTPTAVVTLQNRKAVYDHLVVFLQHLDAFNINLVSIVRNADNTITITVSSPIAADQLDHLGLV